jgi:hypothetical protein
VPIAAARPHRGILDAGDLRRIFVAPKRDNLHPEHTFKTVIECDVDSTPAVRERQLVGDHSEPLRMKTAISIPDALFEEADRLAKRQGWSRSEKW